MLALATPHIVTISAIQHNAMTVMNAHSWLIARHRLMKSKGMAAPFITWYLTKKLPFVFNCEKVDLNLLD
jgi:hypothetical protein